MHNQPDVPLPEGVEVDKRKQRRAAEGPTRATLATAATSEPRTRREKCGK